MDLADLERDSFLTKLVVSTGKMANAFLLLTYAGDGVQKEIVAKENARIFQFILIEAFRSDVNLNAEYIKMQKKLSLFAQKIWFTNFELPQTSSQVLPAALDCNHLQLPARSGYPFHPRTRGQN